MTGELSLQEEFVAAAVLTVQIASVAVGGALIARRAVRRDRLLRWLIGLLVAVALAVGVPLLLGMMGVLYRPVVVAAHAVSVAVIGWWYRRAGGESEGVPAARFRDRPLLVVVAAVGAVVAYLLLAFALSLGSVSSDTDTREYHVTNYATWLREGSIWDLPYQSPAGFTSTHPGDTEMLALWLSVASHGDELAYLMPVVFAALATLGSAVLAREVASARGVGDSDRSAALGAVAATIVGTAPLFFTTQTASLANDIAVAACVVVTLALLAVARNTRSRSIVIWSGIALGLALGGKYTALVPGGLITVAALWLLPRRRDWWLLVPGVLALGAPWYLRNLLATGNPIFPQALGPLSGGQSPLHLIATPMVDHITGLDRSTLRYWGSSAAHLLGPVIGLAALGLLLALWEGVRKRQVVLIVAAIVGAGAFVGYLEIPFTGGGPTGALAFLIVSNLRYSMTAVLLGAVCWAALASPRIAATSIGLVGLWNAWNVRVELRLHRIDVAFSDRRLAAALVLGAVAAFVVYRRVAIAPILRRHAVSAVVAGLVVLLLAGASAFHRYDRGRTTTPLEQALLVYGPEHRVGVLGVGDLRSLLGPRLRRTLVLVSRGGEAGEVPFADENQVRRLLLGDASAPPTPSSLASELDAALVRSGLDLLVVGPISAFTYPEGWRPDGRWCPVAHPGAVVVYATGAALAQTPSAAC